MCVLLSLRFCTSRTGERRYSNGRKSHQKDRVPPKHACCRDYRDSSLASKNQTARGQCDFFLCILCIFFRHWTQHGYKYGDPPPHSIAVSLHLTMRFWRFIAHEENDLVTRCGIVRRGCIQFLVKNCMWRW